ncbi:hypothetical protein GGR58DRAFT_500798 [Xylaria digitata]|nr:hypothetical protein GGR58DRAFT_500798 [Xylaria digitata]
MASVSKQASNAPADPPRESHVEIYESDTGVVRTYQTENLKNKKLSDMLKVPVQKWKMHADVILPADHESGEGPVQIASVPIPLSMAMRRSILGQDQNIYVTTRV